MAKAIAGPLYEQLLLPLLLRWPLLGSCASAACPSLSAKNGLMQPPPELWAVQVTRLSWCLAMAALNAPLLLHKLHAMLSCASLCAGQRHLLPPSPLLMGD
ncbi:hypothetical protein L7F22_008387 [Adiantum nelumboides]|nr:hypothetical protein [Adiantum nelumboides]